MPPVLTSLALYQSLRKLWFILRFVGYNLVPVTNTILFYIHIHEIGMGAIVRRCSVYTHSRLAYTVAQSSFCKFTCIIFRHFCSFFILKVF